MNGAGFLVNITNDAWYGRSAAPVQHLAMAVFRSVEHGAFVVRCANSGISAIIDRRGRIREQSAIFTEAALQGEIGVQAEGTVYTQVGDLFAWLVTAGSAGTGLWRWKLRRLVAPRWTRLHSRSWPLPLRRVLARRLDVCGR